MPQRRAILTLGDPRLRQVARPVKQIDDRLQALIEDLLWTAEQTNGVGIAAPQVGEPLRLFIVASRPNLRYPQAPCMEPTAMINPRIVAQSDQSQRDWEGCLSVPDRRGRVERSRQIEVAYCDRHGTLQRRIFTDFIARIFQHELDHLNGKMFVDRVTEATPLLSEADYLAQLTTVPVGLRSESSRCSE